MLPRQHIVVKFLIVCLAIYGIFSFVSNWLPKYIDDHSKLELVKISHEKRFFSNNHDKNVDPNSIRISNISNIHLDVDKAAVFYVGDNYLVITCLLLAYNEKMFDRVQLIVRKGREIVYNKPVNLNEEIIYSSKSYIFSVIKLNLSHEICSSNCEKVENLNDMTFQLKVNNEKWSPRFPVNVVRQRPNALKNKLAARLIKCMWLPKDVRLFEYIMKLAIESKYDSIYICLFKRDLKLKQILTRLNSTKTTINIIELKNIPNCFPNGPDFTHYDQVVKEDRITDKGEIFDVVNEFLLNQMYPFLIEKYRYVHAADFDHILFTRNLSFIDRIEQIKEKNQITDRESLYFNQYWALPNNISRLIFDKVSSVSDVSDVSSNPNGPIRVDIDELEFSLELAGDEEIAYAMKIRNYLMSRNETQFRHVIFKFSHPYIYGQMVHNTESSMIIKLCSPGGLFSGGSKTTVHSPHLVHYRDEFSFKLLRFDQRFIFMNSFSLWPDFDLSEY